jgi:hypothetical protein
MINTIQIKQQQFEKGTYSTGSGSEVILIIGSCRAVPYLTYLNDWNNQNGNRFTIHFLDPFNWNWDMQENRTDYTAELIKQESNQYLLDVLKSCSIFIHEYYGNAEMFNCDKSAEKNIYQFGLSPKQDITLPNYNDIFVLTREIISFDLELRKLATQDYNVNGKLSDYTLQKIDIVREKNLQRFYDICSKTDFPEFAEIFKNEYKQVRYFWTFNHISKAFNQKIFRLMNEKFLHLPNVRMSEVDLYANNYTYLCEYDEGYKWNEQIKPLKEIL